MKMAIAMLLLLCLLFNVSIMKQVLIETSLLTRNDTLPQDSYEPCASNFECKEIVEFTITEWYLRMQEFAADKPTTNSGWWLETRKKIKEEYKCGKNMLCAPKEQEGCFFFPDLLIPDTAQCGVHHVTKRPGFCDTGNKCTYTNTCRANNDCTAFDLSVCNTETHTCEQCADPYNKLPSNDCIHLQNNLAPGRLQYCRKVDKTKPNNVCVDCKQLEHCTKPDWYKGNKWICTLENKCGRQLTCKGYFYWPPPILPPPPPTGPGLIIIIQDNGDGSGKKEAHFHYNKYIPATLIPATVNYPYIPGRVDKDMQERLKWVNVIKTCKKAVEDSNFEWNVDSFFNPGPKPANQVFATWTENHYP